jgi:hypothetical protein
MAIPAAYPFVEVKIDTSALQPVAQRAPGVIAVVGASGTGSAAPNVPHQVSDLAEAVDLFASREASGAVVPTPLYSSLALALGQDPRPTKIYGVKTAAGDVVPALAALDAVDDVTFVSLAGVTAVGAMGLLALKDHVERNSADGRKRIGVAMVDPTTARTATYVTDVVAAYASLKSDVSRMVLIAARGADGDAATAAMAAIAGYDPQVSMVLKRLRGVKMPIASQYTASEIKALSEANMIPIIDPTLIPGEGLHFAEARTFTTDESLLYIDIVRVLDDIDFRLKAGLVGAVGDARITKAGLTSVKTRIQGILGPLVRNATIEAFAIEIPVLSILLLPEENWTPTERAMVATARSTRTVDVFVSVTYGPAVHRLKVTLAPKF